MTEHLTDLDAAVDWLFARVDGPLRIGARQRSMAVGGAIRSLPPFGSRKHLPSRLATLRQLDGRSAVRVRGQGTEFDSLRDYVEGDDVPTMERIRDAAGQVDEAGR